MRLRGMKWVGTAVFFMVGCATHEGGDNGESHFLCKVDADCEPLGPTYRCGEGECIEQSAVEGGGEPTPSTKSAWPMLGWDAKSTYWNQDETRISRATAGRLREAWRLDLGGSINGAPIQVDGVVYASSSTKRNVAVDVQTGEILWENQDFLATSTMAYEGGRLYVHDLGGVLYALDAASGAQIWQHASPETAGFSSAILAGGSVFVGASSNEELLPQRSNFRGAVAAFDIRDGTETWRTFTVPEGSNGASVWSSVTVDVDEGRAYATTGNNYTDPATDTSDAVLAFELSDGRMVWKNQRYEGDVWSFVQQGGGPDYDIGVNPLLFEIPIDGTRTRLVAAGQKSGDIHVLNRDAGGAEICRRSLSPGSANGAAGVYNNGAWDGEHLLFAANGTTSDAPGGDPPDSEWSPAVLFAVDPATCDIVWERQLPGPVMAPITVANGVGFVGADTHLQAFRTDTGEKLMDYVAPSTVGSAATIADGRVAVGIGIQWSVGSTGVHLVMLSIDGK